MLINDFLSFRSVISTTQHYLEQGTMKPFSQLCDLSAFASKQVYMEPAVPRVFWNTEMTTISIDGELVVLEALREGLKAQVEAIRRGILTITGGVDIPDWLSCKPPIKDDPRNGEPGYSFLEDSRFREAHLPLLRRLVEHPDWRIGTVDNNHRWVWQISSITRFFRETGAIQKAIMPLMQVVSNNRGTELSDTKVANSAYRLRNLTVYQGRLYNNCAYSKTTENTEHDSYNPSLLPPEVSLLLVHYLVVVRPIEKLLSQVIWDEDVAGLYGTYLFLHQGRRLTSEDNSEFLKSFFQEHCNAVIQLNRWRQTSASLSREFIDDRFLAGSRRSAVGMGHSTAVARQHYGQDHDTPAFATSDVLYEQSWVDTEFHALLGFGSKPPPTALRLRKSDEDRIQATIRASLNDMRQGIVQDVLEGLREIMEKEVSLLASRNLVPASDQQQQEKAPSPLFYSHASLPSSSIPDSEPPRIYGPPKRTPWDPSSSPPPPPPPPPAAPALPSSPASPITSIDRLILDAFQAVYGPGALPKSDEQLRLCREVCKMDYNVVAVLPTGSGKSAAWLVPAMMNRNSTTIIVVVVPFKQLLQQHLETALGHKLNAERWRAAVGTKLAPSTNLLFVACESIGYKFTQ
jgi:DEAD/DEAH box helicase